MHDFLTSTDTDYTKNKLKTKYALHERYISKGIKIGRPLFILYQPDTIDTSMFEETQHSLVTTDIARPHNITDTHTHTFPLKSQLYRTRLFSWLYSKHTRIQQLKHTESATITMHNEIAAPRMRLVFRFFDRIAASIFVARLF